MQDVEAYLARVEREGHEPAPTPRTEQTEASRMWREFRARGRQHARRRMVRALQELADIERQGLIRLELLNPDNSHFRVYRADDANVWCDYYPTRGTVMPRYAGAALEARGPGALLRTLGVAGQLTTKDGGHGA